MIIPWLEQHDTLKQFASTGTPTYSHKEHRWTVPLIHYAQESGLVPKPCTLISFDAHTDGKTPQCVADLRRLREAGIPARALIELCQSKLSVYDDDWIKAAMELGLIDNAIVFGIDSEIPAQVGEGRYIDHKNITHYIDTYGLPGQELDYQGRLIDSAKKQALRAHWNRLTWDPMSKDGFISCAAKVFLTIDLDCFVIRWKDYLLPWPQEVWREEFASGSEDWTGYRFFQNLLDRAGFIDIATEPEYCGGDKKSEEIFADLSMNLFGGTLRSGSAEP